MDRPVTPSDAQRRQAEAAFVSALLRSADPIEESEALQRLVATVGAALLQAFTDIEAVMTRIAAMRRHITPIISALADLQTSAQPPNEKLVLEKGTRLPMPSRSEEQQLAQVFEALPPVEKVDHVAPGLARAALEAGIEVRKTPRSRSRGNGLLFVLDRYGRTSEGLSLELLTDALVGMNAVDSTQDARRAAQWEISELLRRRWPIARTSHGRYRYAGPVAKEASV